METVTATPNPATGFYDLLIESSGFLVKSFRCASSIPCGPTGDRGRKLTEAQVKTKLRATFGKWVTVTVEGDEAPRHPALAF